MNAAENQIVVYQPNETVRMECCQCENVATGLDAGEIRRIMKSAFAAGARA